MNLEEKKKEIELKQKYIDSLPYASTIPYPYCCVCFKKLTEYNILEKDGELWDVCLDCKDR
jgi:hypothetical protein